MDVKVEDVFDIVFYIFDVWEKVVDVVFDMFVDIIVDVDEFVRKDVEFLVEEFGYIVEDIVNVLENKVEEVGEREVKKEFV